MKSIDIKGKEYIEVNERIKYFRENYKGFSLISDIVSIKDGVCIIKASILDTERNIIATGTAYEKEGSSFINKTSYIENCYHENTKVLTFNGWKKIKNIESEDKIAQVDLFDSNKISFSKALEKIKQKNQELIHIEDNLTCQVVTPNHNVIIDGIKISAQKLYVQFHDRKKVLDIENKAYKHCTENKINKENEYFIKLLNWIITDGFIDYDKYCHIKFGFKKIEKFERLKYILNMLPIDYTESYNSSNGIYRINIKGEYGKKIVKKYLPRKTLTFELAKNMNHEQAKIFIEELKYTNACIDENNGIYLRQSDKEMFDNCNFLAMRCGYDVCSPTIEKRNTNFKKNYIDHRVCYKKNAKRTSTIFKTIKGLHTVYCLNMPKGTLITKYNNKITISGNCETSAWGRALGNFGIGIDTSIASAEEVSNAIKQQKITQVDNVKEIPEFGVKEKLISEKQAKRLYAILQGNKELEEHQFKSWLANDFSIIDTDGKYLSKIKVKDYDNICKWVENYKLLKM